MDVVQSCCYISLSCLFTFNLWQVLITWTFMTLTLSEISGW